MNNFDWAATILKNCTTYNRINKVADEKSCEVALVADQIRSQFLNNRKYPFILHTSFTMLYAFNVCLLKIKRLAMLIGAISTLLTN